MSSTPPFAALSDRYIIGEEIGRGGMAVVYKARDRRHEREVAVKVLNPEIAAAVGGARFLQEIRTAAGLTHPHIVPVHDSGDVEGVLYYVMPHVTGETLRARVTREPRLSLAEVVGIVRRLASALDFAHRRGIVHRDIKPDNIILYEGEPLILDFGIARAITEAAGDALTRTGTIVGTPAYASPEQVSGDADLDGRSDQYSLACTVYEMIAGAPPFAGGSAQSILARRFIERPRGLAEAAAGTPRLFSDAVARALSLEPADRFATVTEFAERLADAVSGAMLQTRGSTDKQSVAVLPFTNTSAEAENEFFADGVTEEIINALTKVRALDVPSRTASFAFKGRSVDVEEIASKLRVRNILEGSVRKAGNRLRVSVQLVETSTGNTLWSERYDRELEDVFAIQDEIATSIVDALKVMLTGEEKAAIAKVPTDSVRAYEYYLRGRQLFYQRRREALDEAEEMYRRAIALDPGYALAYAGLADASAVRFSIFSGGPAAIEQADAASERALQLDPDLAEAHAARGLVLAYQHKYDAAYEEFTQATRLDPTSFTAAYHYGRALYAGGQLGHAVEMLEKAAALRPDDFQALSIAIGAYDALGRREAAADACRRATAVVERALAINPGDARALSLGAANLQRLGDSARAEEWLQRVLQLDPTNSMTHFNAACMHSLAGKIELALDNLERAVELGFHHRNWLLHDAELDPIRDHPRFASIIERLETE